MKQKTTPTPTTGRSVLKQHHSDKLLQGVVPPPPSRHRASSKARESPKTPPEVVVNRVLPFSSTRAKSVPPDLKNISKAKRGIVLNKPKPSEEVVVVEGSQKCSREAEDASKVVVVTASRPRRRVGSEEDDTDGKKKKKKELQEKLEVSENLIKDLQSEVLALKAELDKVKSLNVELESQNTKLTQDLAAAEAKIAAVGSSSGKVRILMGFCFILLYFASENMECFSTLNALQMF